METPHHILMDMRPGTPGHYVFWTQVHGGTWDQWDSAWLGWLASHILLVIAELCRLMVFIILVIWGCLWCCRRACKGRNKCGYTKVENIDDIGINTDL